MAVSVTVLTGEYAGRTSVMPDDIDPVMLLGGFAKNDMKWSIDYSKATPDEIINWARADIVSRILAALTHDRPVQFQDKVWKPTDDNDLMVDVVGEIEDTVVYSGMNIYLQSDDNNGVVIGTRGLENKVQ